MDEPLTEELLRELLSAPSPQAFTERYLGEKRDLAGYLQELLAEKEATESLRQHQATSQQALMARLAALESPSIGTSQTLSTNQSREAKLVKLPSWMRIGK